MKNLILALSLIGFLAGTTTSFAKGGDDKDKKTAKKSCCTKSAKSCKEGEVKKTTESSKADEKAI